MTLFALYNTLRPFFAAVCLKNNNTDFSDHHKRAYVTNREKRNRNERKWVLIEPVRSNQNHLYYTKQQYVESVRHRYII